MSRILIRRGNKADLPALNVAELGLALDTTELFVGSSSGNIPVWTNAVSSTSFTGNGYQKLPSGFILQWGLDTISPLTSGEGKKTITLPIAFPNAGLFARSNITGVDGNAEGIVYNYTDHATANQTTVTVYVKNIVNTFGAACGITWLAIGY